MVAGRLLRTHLGEAAPLRVAVLVFLGETLPDLTSPESCDPDPSNDPDPL